ncbi:MAG: hypothetical protein HYZ58_13580 [Acidobacteria bacterium]|nr:hypothetical protein [Acidobacteriota bacterium]
MAFDRRFLVPAERLPAVLARAIERCRTATLQHAGLPSSERVDVEYVHDLPWSAFTRYQGRFRSRIQVNADSRLTVDRALDLACHEGYPGHHVIDSLIEARWGTRRMELNVRPLFSPQALLHEGAASVASSLAFDDDARIAFERDELFPLAGLVPTAVADHVRLTRLVDELREAETDVARRYLDGELDFPRASAALARDALISSSDATLKFLNEYRTYAVTYTLGRDRVAAYLDARAGAPYETAGRWRAYLQLVTDPAQTVPGEPARK